MQRAAVLIVPAEFSVNELESRLKTIPDITVLRNNAETDLEVRWGEGQSFYVFVDPSPNRSLAIEDYAEHDDLDDALRSVLSEYEFYVLLCNSLELLKVVVREALDYAIRLGDSWLDDDDAHLLRAQDVLHRLETDPDWDLNSPP